MRLPWLKHQGEDTLFVRRERRWPGVDACMSRLIDCNKWIHFATVVHANLEKALYVGPVRNAHIADNMLVYDNIADVQ